MNFSNRRFSSSFNFYFMIILAAFLSFASVQTHAASSEPFTDVKKHWSYEKVRWSVQAKIASGYPDGTFRPNQLVSEPEFLAMLLRAYPEIQVGAAGKGEAWFEPYYELAQHYHLPVTNKKEAKSFTRGDVAVIVASAAQGKVLSKHSAIQFLLDHSLANGKTSQTVAGFKGEDHLTRAEAVTLIYNIKSKQTPIRQVTPVEQKRAFSALNISLGDSESTVIANLGQPDRKDPSEYAFTWYIYNSDYSQYVQVGIHKGQVAALYSGADVWSSVKGIEIGTKDTVVEQVYGRPLDRIQKGNTSYLLRDKAEGNQAVYLIDGAYTTFYFDRYDQNKLMGLLLVDKAIEESFMDHYGKPSAALRSAYEQQLFDLANVTRTRQNLKPFIWDDTAAETARKHSRDMAEKDYFDHKNLQGQSPFDRMKSDGIRYMVAAENIAAGQSNAINTHADWMNSLGHRKNILHDIERLGTGVYFGGELFVYYTQNFYTPR